MAKREQYDIVIYETTDRDILQAKGQKTGFHVHTDFLSNERPDIDTVVTNTNYFITVSDFMKNRLLKINGVDQNKVLVLKNSIDIDPCCGEDVAKERDRIRNKYGFQESDIVLIFCGRLSEEKGCLELIRALNKIENKHVKLMIVGGSWFSSNKKTSYVKRLEEEAKQISSNIVFTGYIDHDDIWKYMVSSDIGIVPSTCNETASLTMLEFRACGLPTIATRIGGIPEFTNDESTIFIEYDDSFVDNLSNAIDLLCRDSMKRTKMAESSRDGIYEFSYESYYKRFLDLIKLMLIDNR